VRWRAEEGSQHAGDLTPQMHRQARATYESSTDLCNSQVIERTKAWLRSRRGAGSLPQEGCHATRDGVVTLLTN